jgi:hypothetical protein
MIRASDMLRFVIFFLSHSSDFVLHVAAPSIHKSWLINQARAGTMMPAELRPAPWTHVQQSCLRATVFFSSRLFSFSELLRVTDRK